MDNNIYPRILEIISKSSSGAILLPANPTIDALASATALYLALNKINKTVSIVCESKINSDLIASDKISHNLNSGGDNLIISFPYNDGAIDKVDYNIQGSFFNLVIIPRPGFPKIDPAQVKYTYAGAKIDFVITLDSPTLSNLGSSYSDNQSSFQGKEIINIDRHLTNAFFGTINYVNKTSSSVSEMMLKLIHNLNLQIDKDIATNLYTGIAAATNNFTSYSVNADTFEGIASLLRAGAIKKTYRKPEPHVNVSAQTFSKQPVQKSFPVKPFGIENQTVKSIDIVEKEVQPEDPNNSQDWLKPKIFSGGGSLI